MKVATNEMISFLEKENYGREVGVGYTDYVIETASGDVVVTLYGNGMKDKEFFLSEEDYEFLDI